MKLEVTVYFYFPDGRRSFVEHVIDGSMKNLYSDAGTVLQLLDDDDGLRYFYPIHTIESFTMEELDDAKK